MLNNQSNRRRTMMKNLKLAFADIAEGIANWRIWVLLSWQDIRLRYRRSTLGPFWITLSMGITIFTTGFLYAKLFNIDLNQYYPFFSIGMLVWGLISMSVIEGTTIFVGSENFLKQMKQPYSTFIFRVVSRNLIIFMHNMLIFIPLAIFFHIPMGWVSWFSLIGLLLIIINAISFGIILAICGTRFRDITQVINSLIQVVFFMTPIMWSPSILPNRYHFAVDFNPVAQFIELVRNPLMGSMPSSYAIITSLSITVVGLILALVIFARFRARIAYWL